MKINHSVDFLFLNFSCCILAPNMCHPMPSSPSLHMHIRLCRQGFASSHPFQCVNEDHVGHTQHPKI
jgi:hypothetical protein